MIWITEHWYFVAGFLGLIFTSGALYHRINNTSTDVTNIKKALANFATNDKLTESIAHVDKHIDVLTTELQTQKAESARVNEKVIGRMDAMQNMIMLKLDDQTKQFTELVVKILMERNK